MEYYTDSQKAQRDDPSVYMKFEGTSPVIPAKPVAPPKPSPRPPVPSEERPIRERPPPTPAPRPVFENPVWMLFPVLAVYSHAGHAWLLSDFFIILMLLLFTARPARPSTSEETSSTTTSCRAGKMQKVDF